METNKANKEMSEEKESIRENNEITGFQLFSMTTSMVMTVYGFAAFAKQGPTALFYLFLAGVLWFLPVTRSAGEMASIPGWSKGGIFTWTSNMLGEKTGWSALFYQWIHITVGMNTMMFFIIGCFSVSLNLPIINTNPFIKYMLVLIILWGLIAIQQRGTKVTGRIAQWCFSIGVVIPVLFLIVLFIGYLAMGNKMLITINWHTLFPKNIDGSTLVGFVPFILAFAGAEGSAPHVENLKDRKVYPKVMTALLICAILSDIIGSMSIAATIPNDKIQLSTGIVYAYGTLATHFHMAAGIVEKITGLLLAIGVLGEISSWVVGPNKGMYVAATQGFLPKRFAKINKYGIETNVMILQGIIVSLMGALLVFGAGKSGAANVSFTTAMSLTVAIYTLMYILMFISYLVLQFKHADMKRGYYASKSGTVRIIYGILGLALSLFGFVVTFFPPASLNSSAKHAYMFMLLTGFFIVLFIPFILYSFHKKWKSELEEQEKTEKIEG